MNSTPADMAKISDFKSTRRYLIDDANHLALLVSNLAMIFDHVREAGPTQEQALEVPESSTLVTAREHISNGLHELEAIVKSMEEYLV